MMNNVAHAEQVVKPMIISYNGQNEVATEMRSTKLSINLHQHCMDLTLHDILRDGLCKYLGGKEQITYMVEDLDDIGYWVLQKNQAKIELDNLIREFF